MKLNPRITAITLVIIYISLVFFCCLYRFSGSESLDLGQYFLGIRLDRCIHFTMFLPYPFVGWILINYDKKLNGWKKYTFSILLISGMILATTAEASQEMLTSYRDTDPFDLIANFIGIATGTLLVYILKGFLKRISDWIFTV